MRGRVTEIVLGVKREIEKSEKIGRE